MTREEANNKIGELAMYARSQGWDDEYTDAVNMAIKALEQESCEDCVSRWIPVSERFPEEAGRYLTTCDFNTSGRYVSIQVWDDGWGDCGDCVVAWMALPEPYREGK